MIHLNYLFPFNTTLLRAYLLLSLIIASFSPNFFSPLHASTAGTPEQDPYITWARKAYANGRVPFESDLLEGHVWKCTMAFSIKDVFYTEKVPAFKFRVDGSLVLNDLTFDEQDESFLRRYAFHYPRFRKKNVNLSRVIKLGWRVSSGSGWANPELYTEFTMNDAIRIGVGGRLIVQRSISDSDKKRLSKTYGSYLRSLGLPPKEYKMPEAIPEFGNNTVPLKQKYNYAFQYFVCDKPNGNLPAKEGEEEPPLSQKPARPSPEARTNGQECIDSSGKSLMCIEKQTPELYTVVEWLTGSTPTATKWSGVSWFVQADHLEQGRSDQTVQFTEDSVKLLNEIFSSTDSEGYPINVILGKKYLVKSVMQNCRCRNK
jgi:hypothetical protein